MMHYRQFEQTPVTSLNLTLALKPIEQLEEDSQEEEVPIEATDQSDKRNLAYTEVAGDKRVESFPDSIMHMQP